MFTHNRLTPIVFLLMSTLLLAACGGNAADEATTVTLFFGNPEGTSPLACDAVAPVERDLPPEGEPLESALEALFAGPTETEQAAGYSSFFSAETAGILRGVRIEDNTAYVNLEDIRDITPGVSSSCGSQAFLAEVGATVQAANPDVERVLYAIEGDPATFYEWIQVGCTTENDNCDPTPFQDLDNA